jgi:hypothetical protein
MLYEITLRGCDGQTIVTIELTEQEKTLIDRISELSILTSDNQCMPEMYIKEVSREGKKQASTNKEAA